MSKTGKKCFIVTHMCFIGETPFDKVFSDRDIMIVCETFEDANEFIDEQIQHNVDIYDRENGKGVITHEVRRPEFFEGRNVEVLFHDTKDNKKWLWTYDIFERTMYIPKKKKS